MSLPSWLVQAVSHYSLQQQSQALYYALNSLDFERLAEFYDLACYYRPAMRRELQEMVDAIGIRLRKEQQMRYQMGMGRYVQTYPAHSLGQWMDFDSMFNFGASGGGGGGGGGDAVDMSYYGADDFNQYGGGGGGGGGGGQNWGNTINAITQGVTGVMKAGAGLVNAFNQGQQGGVGPGMGFDPWAATQQPGYNYGQPQTQTPGMVYNQQYQNQPYQNNPYNMPTVPTAPGYQQQPYPPQQVAPTVPVAPVAAPMSTTTKVLLGAGGALVVGLIVASLA